MPPPRMAPPAAGGPSASSSSPEPPRRVDAAKRRCRPARRAGAWARLLSMGVQGCVMTAALALFLLFAFAACVLMVSLVFAAHAFRRQGGGRHRADPPDRADPPPPRPAGLAPAQIARFPCSVSPCPPRDAPPPTCAVCLEPSRAGERWRALPPCAHAFHAACVDRWLLLSPACPVCRATVAVPAEKS